jgi:hypothetical protein
MVTVCTPAEMAQRIVGIKKGCEEGVRRGLVKACVIAETQAKRNVTPGSSPYTYAPFDTGLLRAHIGYSIDMDSVDEYIASIGVEKDSDADNYAFYVHEGSRPHNASMDAIKAWAARKSRGGTTIPWFQVWLKIAREGTESKPFLLDAIESTKDEYMPIIEQEYLKALVSYCARYG